jgi:imidazolonepropionase-like amidohydrolase
MGRIPPSIYGPYEELEVFDLNGAWVTPGIVDAHSHIGDGAAPALAGAEDTNSLKGTTQPWLRSLDGLNTHDDSYTTSIAGGVTTANVLPGSANAIGLTHPKQNPTRANTETRRTGLYHQAASYG